MKKATQWCPLSKNAMKSLITFMEAIVVLCFFNTNKQSEERMSFFSNTDKYVRCAHNKEADKCNVSQYPKTLEESTWIFFSNYSKTFRNDILFHMHTCVKQC